MHTFRPCRQPCLESDVKCPTTLVLQTFTQSIRLYVYIYIYSCIVIHTLCTLQLVSKEDKF